jgi:hypothetical protein
MIAARPIQDLTRGLGRNAFDLPVAALAGLAAAFIAFAMPPELLGRLVGATGLPHFLAAAEPPLGFKARAMIGIAGAAAAFGLVYMLLGMLDRAGRKRARPEPELEEEDRPRLRRRDVHPDAPVCRPISAARDFGEPAPPPLERDEEPVPVWLAPAEAESADPRPEPAAEEHRSGFRRRDIRHDAAGRQPISAARDFGEPAPLEPDEPEVPTRLAEPALPPEAEIEPAPLWAEAPEEPLELTSRAAPAWLSEPEPEAAEPVPGPVAADASLGDLMRRLEQGLARRRTRHAFASAPQHHASPPQVFPEANDDRLQSAIESLQRFAARGD